MPTVGTANESPSEVYQRRLRKDAAEEPYNSLLNKLGESGTDPGHDRSGSIRSESAEGRQQIRNADVADATSAFGGFRDANNVQRIDGQNKISESQIRREEAYETFLIEIARMRERQNTT